MGPKVALFAIVAVVLLVIDQATKALFVDATPGTLIAGPFAGLIDIRLVHNTGGAWGIFSDSTFALGIVSIVVCVLIVCYFAYARNTLSWMEVLGLGLVFAGGIGNAIDRFAQGFVTDFLEFAFIDFPVFNIADCGVTCGFVIFILGIILHWKALGNE